MNEQLATIKNVLFTKLYKKINNLTEELKDLSNRVNTIQENNNIIPEQMNRQIYELINVYGDIKNKLDDTQELIKKKEYIPMYFNNNLKIYPL